MNHVKEMYQNYFLDYASYVILERAVPAMVDGLKPVQRRILHSMYRLEDGTKNKVQTIIGETAKFHPHGDMSINDAIVQIGQKGLLLTTQGNWGNVVTGDSSAAARYIEAKLSPFALEAIFSPQLTETTPSYDGKNQEPVAFPSKFPFLLVQGTEGIAVGLSCKMLPHNFSEIVDALISGMKGKKVKIMPDFPTGGIADFREYNDGARGGKIKVRAKIEPLDKNSLIITEVAFSTTTVTLIESIISANEKGKIKIKKIDDNTAAKVEIVLHLPPGSDLQKTIDALYVFTKCEVSVSPNAVVIKDGKPFFCSISDIIDHQARQTVDIFRKETELKKKQKEKELAAALLEKLFLEKEVYRKIEKAESEEEAVAIIKKELASELKKLPECDDSDIAKLLEIKIRRIAKFDATKAEIRINDLRADIKELEDRLVNIVEYSISFMKELKKKYGVKRKTVEAEFEKIVANKVVISNEKLYVNKEEGFAGYGMKKDEYVCECSDIDDVAVFCKSGVMKVARISDKAFFEKDIIHIELLNKEQVYHMIYEDGAANKTFVKRFKLGGITREKPYFLAREHPDSKVLYFAAMKETPEKVKVHLKPGCGSRKTEFEYDFSELDVKGRESMGNMLSRYPVKKITKV